MLASSHGTSMRIASETFTGTLGPYALQAAIAAEHARAASPAETARRGGTRLPSLRQGDLHGRAQEQVYLWQMRLY